jgi:hypothetical protein
MMTAVLTAIGIAILIAAVAGGILHQPWRHAGSAAIRSLYCALVIGCRHPHGQHRGLRWRGAAAPHAPVAAAPPVAAGGAPPFPKGDAPQAPVPSWMPVPGTGATQQPPDSERDRDTTPLGALVTHPVMPGAPREYRRPDAIIAVDETGDGVTRTRIWTAAGLRRTGVCEIVDDGLPIARPYVLAAEGARDAAARAA